MKERSVYTGSNPFLFQASISASIVTLFVTKSHMRETHVLGYADQQLRKNTRNCSVVFSCRTTESQWKSEKGRNSMKITWQQLERSFIALFMLWLGIFLS